MSVSIRSAARVAVVSSCVLVGSATTARAQSFVPSTFVGTQRGVSSAHEGRGVDEALGTFNETIPISVPAFREITPQLSLAYDSSAKGGWTGVGWSLTGIGRIERVSAGRGAPKYDGTDTFMIDGQELVPCVAGGVSPGCAAGGTYATKNESFSKISFDAATKVWTVVGKDGTKSIYTPTYTVAGDSVLRWGVRQVIDTKGNAVTYTWAGDTTSANCAFDCTADYIESISYNGTTIKFHYEDRPDPEESAGGAGQHLTITGRLKTIDVSVSGSRVRAYKLSYTTSSATARSLLSSVQQFGKDATLDASGTVTGGTSLPAMTFGYQAGTPVPLAGTYEATPMTYNANSRYFPMDINGDGKQDLLEIYPYTSTVCSFFVICTTTTYWGRTAWLSNGTAFTQGSNATGMAYNANASFLPMDVNGDGKMDFVELYPSGTSTGRRIWVSNGTAFTAGTADSWAIPYAEANQYLPADVNGDGKMDMIEVYPYSNGANIARKLWISNGTAFTAGALEGWVNLGQKLYTLDINGDGKTDVVHMYPYNNGTNTARQVYLSNGAGYVLGDLDGLMAWNQQFLAMDVNGDGKDDFVNVYPGNNNTETWRTVWISSGTGLYIGGADGWTYCCDNKFVQADVNGDGRADIIEMFPGANYFGRQVWLSNGTGYAWGAFDGNQLAVGTTTQFLGLDFSGDGLGDMLELKPNGSSMSRKVWKTGGSFPDLLTSVTNGWGGSTAVAYTPSSAWTNTNLPWVSQNPTSVTSYDGRGGSATTTYAYAGGLYNWTEGQFMGFRTVKETLPLIGGETAAPYNEITFRQDANTANSPERIDRKNGSNQLLSSVVYEYTTNGTTIPRTGLETGVWNYMYTGAGTPCPGAGCKRKYTNRAFNAYGEVTQEVDYGDYDVAGDEMTTLTTYSPNTSAYIVESPSSVVVRQGIGGAGAVLNQTIYYYDGAANSATPPVAGLPTKTGEWLSSNNTFVETSRQYDSWGNIVADVSPLGAVATYSFDATYHIYPTGTVNPLSQGSTATWDPVCGKVVQAADINHQVSSLTYDNLCRLASVSSPNGKFMNVSYVNLGSATGQYIQVEQPGADSSGPMWSRSYLDGMQRTWRTVQKGPTAAADIYVDTAFNPRGALWGHSAPFYWGAGMASPTLQTTVYTYDGLDRVTRVTNPDNTFSSRTYGLWSVTNTDELGRAKTDRYNAYGNRIAHDEVVAGATKTTTFGYDARQNHVQTTDPSGNVTTTRTIDSLGRVTAMTDLDWGASTYEYDNAGRITATTDAKSQRTTIGYDALDRKISKTTNAGTAQAATVAWAYDQARAGYFNTGALTTMTDAAGSKTYDYDASGRAVKIVRTINGTPYVFQYGYDAGDRPLWTIYPDGDTLGTLVYDGAGRLATIPGYVASATYNAEGSLTQVVNANGTVTNRAFSAQRSWITGITTTAGATVLQNLAYTRNAKGLITGVTSPIANEGWTYTKDELDRMTGATNTGGATYNQTVAYDAIGNITSNSRLGAYVYGTAKKHAVTAAGANTYAYDATGSMISGAGRTLTWNGDNLLATVTSGGVTTTMTYDGNGDRIMQAEGATGRVHLGDDYEINGSSVTKYVTLGGMAVARKDGATVSWLHTDQLGSIQAETNAAGAEILRKKYRPYGEILASSGTVSYEPRGFTAQRQDASGLVYLHSRYYDPVLGRFISPDRIIDGADTVGLNRYAYTANDPIDFTDIDGYAASKPNTKNGNKVSPKTKAPSSNNSKGQNNNSSLNKARNVSSGSPGNASNTNRSSNLDPVKTSPGAARTTQIRSTRDQETGGTWLKTQHSTHYFAPPPPPPPPPVSAPGFVSASGWGMPAPGVTQASMTALAVAAPVPPAAPPMSIYCPNCTTLQDYLNYAQALPPMSADYRSLNYNAEYARMTAELYAPRIVPCYGPDGSFELNTVGKGAAAILGGMYVINSFGGGRNAQGSPYSPQGGSYAGSVSLPGGGTGGGAAHGGQ